MGMGDHCKRERQSLRFFVGFIFLSVEFMTFSFFWFWFYLFCFIIFFNIVLTWKIVGVLKISVLYIYIDYNNNNKKDKLM